MRDTYIADSLSGKKVLFEPLVPGKVSLYCCGPTVYSDPHIGNFRPVVVFDQLVKYFRAIGYDVTYVSNYTDVDDKIINRAKELGISEAELSEGVIAEFARLVKEVGSSLPDITPRPTKMMNEIIAYIRRLEEKGHAYEVDGNVYFRVRKIPSYGALSGNTVDNLEKGARIEVDSAKEDPLDFALWKKTADGIKWNSPWGEGRPGWHTECCVMIDTIFRDQGGYIDIHGGGFDLKFPHHENERAQSFAQNGNGLAHYWMHNGFIDIVGEKMSKSLGNVVLMKDVAKDYGGLPFRLMVLSTHYRAPLSYSDDKMKEAKEKYDSLAASLRKAFVQLSLLGREKVEAEAKDSDLLEELSDDLNTPNALSRLYAEQKALNQALRMAKKDPSGLENAYKTFVSSLKLMGLYVEPEPLSEEDKQLYFDYNKAKDEKDFGRSDLLRAKLIEKGIF